MNEQEIVDVKKISQNLIGNWLFFGMVFEFVFIALIFKILKFDISTIIFFIIAITLQTIAIHFTWKFSISNTFKKQTFSIKGIPLLSKYLFIFTIVLWILCSILNHSYSVEKSLENNEEMIYMEKMINVISSKDQIEQYNSTKRQAIDELKKQTKIFIHLYNISLLIVFIIELLIHRKKIADYCIMNII